MTAKPPRTGREEKGTEAEAGGGGGHSKPSPPPRRGTPGAPGEARAATRGLRPAELGAGLG